MQGSRVLRRVSSLVLNSPDNTAPRSDVYQAGPHLDAITLPTKSNEIGDPIMETVPDSEEERMRVKKRTSFLSSSVIEMSSDEDDVKENLGMSIPLYRGPTSPVEPVKGYGDPSHPSTARTPKAIDRRNLDSRDLVKNTPKIQIIRSRQVVQSSSSEDSDGDSDHSDVFKFGDGSPARPPRALLTQAPDKAVRTGPEPELAAAKPIRRTETGHAAVRILDDVDNSPKPTNRPLLPHDRKAPLHHVPLQSQRVPGPSQLPQSTVLSLYTDDDDEWDANDGSVLTLDEPKSARKPIRLPKLPDVGTSRSKAPLEQPTSRTEDLPDSESSTSESEDDFSPALDVKTPARSRASPTKQKAPRLTKAARALAEQQRREAYALDFFLELNRDVFGGGLPNETKLIWNKRLTTTAGRAKWHRSREGVETTSVELAVKILDCEERIRNTLSHEMCHLASWYIDGESNEGHGAIWKKWATKVMRKCPDILISTKHNYEITYPYEWKCEKCGKIYGRFSKSIRPDECLCGACRVGKLKPLFTVRSKGTPKTVADSKNAADKPQDSPRSVNRRPQVSVDGTVAVNSPITKLSTETVVDLVDDSDDEVEILAIALGGRLVVAD